MAVVLKEEIRDGVTLLTMHRPERLNSLNMELVTELEAALAAADADERCRVVILTGAGRGFCSGADLRGEGEQPGADAHATVQSGMRVQEAYAAVVTRMRAMRTPVIAAINGPAVGGGLAIALGADVRVAAASARFGVAMVRIGLSGGDMGISYLLPRAVGYARAFELMLTGRLFDVAEAERLGLLSRTTPNGGAVDAAVEIAEAILANSPFGVWMTKQVMWAALEAGSLQGAVEIENRSQILAIQTEDSVEAVAAYFTEKRPPRYAGR